MAVLAKIRDRRCQLQKESDFLRLRLNTQCQRLRPAALLIEQGYDLARALSQNHQLPRSWLKDLIVWLKDKSEKPAATEQIPPT